MGPNPDRAPTRTAKAMTTLEGKEEKKVKKPEGRWKKGRKRNEEEMSDVEPEEEAAKGAEEPSQKAAQHTDEEMSDAEPEEDVTKGVDDASQTQQAYEKIVEVKPEEETTEGADSAIISEGSAVHHERNKAKD